MKKINNHIELIDKIALKATDLFLGEQDVVVRFVFCAIEKLNKVNKTIKILYPQINSNNEIDFSVSILLRSLLMDCIQVQYIASIIQNDANKPLEEVKKDVEKKCWKLIGDGTDGILNNISNDNTLDEDKKRNAIQNILNQFPNIVENTKNKKYINTSKDETTISRLYNHSKSNLAKERDEIYTLYSGFSKYEHLSHWTSLIHNNRPFSQRLNAINKSIVMIVLTLRVLLIIAHEYGDKKTVIDCIEEINQYMDSPEFP